MKAIYQIIGSIFVRIAILAGIVMLVFWMWQMGMLNTATVDDPLDIYQKEYSRCMTRETIGHEECHDIALRVAYPNERVIETDIDWSYRQGD